MSKIRKPATILLTALAAICITSLFLASCHDTAGPTGGGKGGDSVCVPNPKDTSSLGRINHFIPKSEIMAFRKAFNADSLNRKYRDLFITESEGFNKTQLLDLLSDPKCVGIRIYYGITKGKEKNELKMIIVGTDNQGKDLYYTNTGKAATRLTQDEVGLEYGQCCQGQPVQN
ncbi:MAG: hypothetical protein ABIQ88_16125 [Chitinophagaceae bacterium]